MKNHANKIQFLKIERCRFLDDYYAQFESRTEKAKAAQEIQVADIMILQLEQHLTLICPLSVYLHLKHLLPFVVIVARLS